MTCQSRDFLHRWILPNVNLVERVSMSGDDFICGLGEHQIANLRSSINVVDWLKSMSVPESNATISSTSTCCEKSSLVWIPGNGFDGGIMFAELSSSLFTSVVPDHKFVIVSSTC